MGFISHFLANSLFNRSTMNAKLDEISGAFFPIWKLIQIIDSTTDGGAMSGTWTAPDILGDGQSYDLGVYVIGAGGSGGARHNNNTSYRAYASGGASGYGKNAVFSSVSPGTEFNWVIGSGGASVTDTNSYGVVGQNGGTTTFSGVSALGGEGGFHTRNVNELSGALGGQPSDTDNTKIMTAPYGCVSTMTAQYSTSLRPQPEREGQNSFDPSMVTLGAGGFSFFASQGASYKQTTAAVKYGKAGAGGLPNGQAATGYGNGGGAAVSGNVPGTTPKPVSGAGAPGAILIYVRSGTAE